MGVKIQGSKIYLPKVGWMRFYNSRPIPDGYVIKAATVRKRQNGWYVSIRIEDKEVPNSIVKPLSEVNKIIGCDLGITKLVHLSDGTQIENPKFGTSKKFKRLLKIRQRRVNRKVKGSKNRKKAAKIVGRLHQKATNKRDAYQWKVANQIASRNIDAIALEGLNISGIIRRGKVKVDEKNRFLKNGQSRKKGLNRTISDSSWGNLTLKIEYLAAKQGKIVIKVNPKYSSQECRKSKHIDKSNRDKEKFICTQCGHRSHADIGAAKTIRDRASEMVRADCAEPSARHSNAQKVSPRSQSFRGEFGNLKIQDIKVAKS
jgi:putative transposase